MSTNKLWYHTTDPEGFWHGKCATREDAVADGRSYYDGDPFCVAWAVNDPIRLADWIDADRLLERAEDRLADSDRVCGEFDDDIVFRVTPAQERDLEDRIKRVCDEWQAAHNLVFTFNTFSAMGEPEWINSKEGYGL